jgi:hypothetical protein
MRAEKRQTSIPFAVCVSLLVKDNICSSSTTPLDVEDDISVGTAVKQLDDNPGLLTQALQPVKGTSHTLSLLQQHTTQLSQASCSIASATVALNALSSRGTDILPAPTDPLYQAPCALLEVK